MENTENSLLISKTDNNAIGNFSDHNGTIEGAGFSNSPLKAKDIKNNKINQYNNRKSQYESVEYSEEENATTA